MVTSVRDNSVTVRSVQERIGAVRSGRHHDSRRSSPTLSPVPNRRCRQHCRAVSDLRSATQLLGRANRNAQGTGRGVDSFVHATPQTTRQGSKNLQQFSPSVVDVVAACVPKTIHKADASRFERPSEAQIGEDYPGGVELAGIESASTRLRQHATVAVLGSPSLESVGTHDLRHGASTGSDSLCSGIGSSERIHHSPQNETKPGDGSQAASRYAGVSATTSGTRERIAVPVAVQASANLAGVRQRAGSGWAEFNSPKQIPQTETDIGNASRGCRWHRGSRTTPRPHNTRAGVLNLYRSAIHSQRKSGRRFAETIDNLISRSPSIPGLSPVGGFFMSL